MVDPLAVLKIQGPMSNGITDRHVEELENMLNGVFPIFIPCCLLCMQIAAYQATCGKVTDFVRCRPADVCKFSCCRGAE